SVAVLGRVVLWRDDETASLARPPVHRLDNVHHLLLVLQGPVDLVVVARAQVDHDVLVAEEEHDRARVVQLIHLVEVRHLRDVHQVDGRKTHHRTLLLYLLYDAVEHLIHLHAGRVPVVAEADHHHPVLLRQDGLVHLPAIVQVLQHVRHG
ncbi:unnamed protein product, partial [Ixodes hexagonus]